MKAYSPLGLVAGVSLPALLAALIPSLARGEYSANFPPAISAVGRDTSQIHSYFMIIITVLFVVVCGIAIHSMVKHSKSADRPTSKFAGLTGTVQWLWAVVPFAILLFIDVVLIRIHFTS